MIDSGPVLRSVRRALFVWASVSAVAYSCVAGVSAQTSAEARFAGSAASTAPQVPSAGAGLTRTDLSFVASLAVPGSGQYLLGQNRWVPYVAVEAWAWVRYIDQRATSQRLSREYKDLAWSIARRVSTGARRDTTFPYYEVLIHYRASGAFDGSAEPGVQPEFDDATYNGEQWKLAQSLFIPAGAAVGPGSPSYDAALAYYEKHAIPDGYAFAWNSGRLEQQTYTNVINESDAAYRDATRMLGLILANHLTSAVDALISTRLRNGAPGLRFESGLTPDSGPRPGPVPPPLRLDLQLRYRW